MIKVIGIGNILLSDDGIGVKVVEELMKDKIFIKDTQCIIGETDFWYCVDNIRENDFVIIIDSSFLGKKPGTISVIPLEDCDKYMKEEITEHGDSLINVLRREERNVNGICIGIEAEAINFSTELSVTLNNNLQHIISKVKEIITEYNLWFMNQKLYLKENNYD